MLGDMSYCLYLIHLTIISLTVRVCSHFGWLATLSATGAVAGLVAASLLGAVVLHLRVERPLMRFVRGHTPRTCR